MAKHSDAHLELIEARLTILERRIRLNERLDGRDTDASGLPRQIKAEGLYLDVDRPDVVVFPAHTLERDLEGRAFRWITAGPTIQFLLPRLALESYSCHFDLHPHSAVDTSFMAVTVGATNDNVPFTNGLASGDGLALTIPPDLIPWVSITFHGLTAVLPSQIGEGSDDRPLTARFYGVRFAPIQSPI